MKENGTTKEADKCLTRHMIEEDLGIITPTYLVKGIAQEEIIITHRDSKTTLYHVKTEGATMSIIEGIIIIQVDTRESHLTKEVTIITGRTRIKLPIITQDKAMATNIIITFVEYTTLMPVEGEIVETTTKEGGVTLISIVTPAIAIERSENLDTDLTEATAMEVKEQ